MPQPSLTRFYPNASLDRLLCSADVSAVVLCSAPVGTVADQVRAPHMLVADSPDLLRWLNAKLESTIHPALRAQFNLDDMWLYDSFLLKFDGVPGRDGLAMHVDDDGRGISFNLLLSDAGDFKGGGTYFPGISPPVVRPQRGDLLSHYGGLKHASVPTTGGQRYILVGFLRSPRLLEQLGD